MSTLKQTLSYLILGQRGGQNRIEIIEALRERPYNLNQLADRLDLNYRTVKHHIDMLLKHGLVNTSSSGKYGEVYFLSSDLERNSDLLEETKKKLTEVAASPRLFQSVMEQTNDAVIILDSGKEVIFINPSAERMFGHSSEKSVGRAVQVFRDPAKFMRLLSKIGDTQKTQSIETEGRCKDGKIIDIDASIDVIKGDDGSTIGYSIILRDITERKMLQENLRQSEERYALAQQAANIGSWDWNIATGNLKWSDNIESIYGFSPGKFGGTYESFLKSVYPEDKKRLEGCVSLCISKRKKFDLEHRIIWPDGTIRWVRETGDVIRNRKGKAVRMVGIVRDITDRIELARKVRHLASFPQLNPNPVIEMDLKGKIIFFNRGVIDSLRRIGAKRDISQFLPADIGQILKSFRDGKTKSAVRNVHVGGAIFEEGIAYAPDFNTARIYAMDVTEQVTAERKLGQILETAPEGFWINDLKGNLKEVNDYYCKMVGYSRAELLCKTVNDMEAEENREETKRHIRKIIHEGYDLFETRHRRKDGTAIPLEISANYSHLDGGIFIVFMRDITSRKKMENELRRANEGLEMRVRQRTAELEAAHKSLKESADRFRHAFDNMLEGCMIIGHDWTYLYVNDVAAEHGKQRADKLIGRKITEMYPGVEKTPIFRAYKRCMEERKPQHIQSSYKFEDGTTRCYEFRIEPVPEGIFVLSLDNTLRYGATQNIQSEETAK